MSIIIIIFCVLIRITCPIYSTVPDGSIATPGKIMLKDGKNIVPETLLLDGGLSYGPKLIVKIPSLKNRIRFIPFEKIKRFDIEKISTERITKEVEKFVFGTLVLKDGKHWYVKTDLRRLSYHCKDCPTFNGITYLAKTDAGEASIERIALGKLKAIEFL